MLKEDDVVVAIRIYENTNVSVLKYTGKIIRFSVKNDCFLVQFKGWHNGHDGGGFSKNGDCWWFPESYLKIVTMLSQKEIIVNKIKEIAARRKSLGYRF